ncbi:hypothetical protein WICPIJ_009839, partial [Wickerhamomyces pijperi]
EFITTDRENKIKKYKRDLKTKKLYNNVFKNSAQAVIDKSDGVARCSNCHWEVEGNYCENCNTRLRNPNRIQEEFFDSDIDSDDRHHVVRYVNGNNDEDDDENSDTQPNSDDADFIDDRPIRNLDVYNENSDYSSGGSSPARQMPHDQSGLVEIVNRGGRRNVIPVTDSEEEQSDRDAPDYESWNGIHSSSSSQRNDPNSDSYNDSHSDGYRSEGSYNGQYQGEMHQGEDYGHYNQYNRNGYSSEEQEQRGYGHEQDYDDQYHSDEDHSSNGSYYSEENNENQGQYDNGEDYRDQDQYYKRDQVSNAENGIFGVTVLSDLAINLGTDIQRIWVWDQRRGDDGWTDGGPSVEHLTGGELGSTSLYLPGSLRNIIANSVAQDVI